MQARTLLASMAALAGGFPDMPRGSRGNKYRPRETEFVVIYRHPNDTEAFGHLASDPPWQPVNGHATFSSRVEARAFVRRFGLRSVTVKPINSLAAQKGR